MNEPAEASAEPKRPLVTPADLAACREMIRTGSKTFHTSSSLFPRRIRDASRALYGFCRVADDAVDQSDDVEAAVRSLKQRLDAIDRLEPEPYPADRAYADLAFRYAIPRELPDALIDGFVWDASGQRCRNESDLIAYAVRVAGAVGAMMAIVMESRAPEAIARATDLGIAMQLTNIARDVGADAAIGRLYLPEDWMRQAGLDPDSFLDDPRPSGALAEVVRRLLERAEFYYDRALSGIALLPFACRPAIHASRLLYREIGREVARNGHDSVTQRAVVPKRRKLALLGEALVLSVSAGGDPYADPAAEAQFVVDAVMAAPIPRPWPIGFDEKAEWLTNLFLRLDGRRP